MKSYTLNQDLTGACEALYEAFTEGTDSIAFEELSTIQLMKVQAHVNEILIKRFVALQTGVIAMMQVDDDAFNDRNQLTDRETPKTAVVEKRK